MCDGWTPLGAFSLWVRAHFFLITPRLQDMTKSELIELLAQKQEHLPARDVELAVKTILELMSDALATGERVEVRGFGSFTLHFRQPRQGRNPKTGEQVTLPGRHVPHFKPGKEMRLMVNEDETKTV